MGARTDRSPSHHAQVAAPALGDELAASMSVAARHSRATSDDADDVTGQAPRVSGAYIYGYDPAGEPHPHCGNLLLLLRPQAASPDNGLGRRWSGLRDEPGRLFRRAAGARRAGWRAKHRRRARSGGAPLRAPPGQARQGRHMPAVPLMTSAVRWAGARDVPGSHYWRRRGTTSAGPVALLSRPTLATPSRLLRCRRR